MLNLLTGWLIFCCSVALLAACAAASNAGASDARRPDVLVATVGDILTRIDGPKLWTMSGIEWRGTVIAVEDSAYGCVITYPGAQHLGTAHFLEVPGHPGEIEKEQVTELRFFVDDQPVTDIQKTMHVSGKSLRVERISKIRSFDLDSLLVVRDGTIVQSVRLRTDKPVELQSSYPLMYAWTPTATEYLFGGGAEEKSGTFLEPSAKATEGLEKDATWMAVYDGPTGKGAVACVVERPKDADAWLQYTDAPKIYRKLRLMTFVKATVPAGFDGTYRMAIGFFTAGAEDWKTQARDRVNDLKAAVSAK
jgi:hypothetical protein